MNNLNQIAWETLFKRYKILEEVDKNGIFYISADQIKKTLTLNRQKGKIITHAFLSVHQCQMRIL